MTTTNEIETLNAELLSLATRLAALRTHGPRYETIVSAENRSEYDALVARHAAALEALRAAERAADDLLTPEQRFLAYVSPEATSGCYNARLLNAPALPGDEE